MFPLNFDMYKYDAGQLRIFLRGTLGASRAKKSYVSGILTIFLISHLLFFEDH